MTFYEVIENLYSDDLEKNLYVINKSIYTKEVDEKSRLISAIHTGFSFLSQTGKIFELFYIPQTSIIVRQVRNENFVEFPILIGLFCVLSGDFYNKNLDLILSGVSSEGAWLMEKLNDRRRPTDDTGNLVSCLDESKNEVTTFNAFKLISGSDFDEENNPLNYTEFPLSKKLKITLFFNGEVWVRFVADKEFSNNNLQKKVQDSIYKINSFRDIKFEFENKIRYIQLDREIKYLIEHGELNKYGSFYDVKDEIFVYEKILRICEILVSGKMDRLSYSPSGIEKIIKGYDLYKIEIEKGANPNDAAKIVERDIFSSISLYGFEYGN